MLNHLPQEEFTLRELEIIRLIQLGFTSQEIAQQLHISAFTTKKHRENIAKKIGSHGKKEFRRFIRNFKI
ncbi:response regulator transcription factor [Aquirufa rosea]|uniref:Response regulator transcription factor n=1 Tax=Aquirufa rosea TaxID=2509241 RepID=A0A4Q1BYD4_9BACT|nr:LuxR C-terminal-related transcriptional regulator [Aquirufa rosea]RXK48079.1 response regulator transcription factor [Aquirufa rosea]